MLIIVRMVFSFIGQILSPDSVWFDSIYSESVNLYWHVDSLVDGYKFRYRELVVIGR